MSTGSSSTVGGVDAKVESLFGQLPEEVSGWEKHERDPEQSLFEYWKKGSTHIVGKYEQIVAKELRDEEIRVTKRTYDQFNHLLNTRTLIEKEPKDADRLWRTAKERMEEFPASGPFDSPPEIPVAIGDWELVTESFEQPLNVTIWERPFGEAELVVEQTDVVAHYSHTKRPHEIRYREPDTDAVVVIGDTPRTSTFEIAINSLRALSAPLSEMGEQQDALQTVKGIGPAKSQQFLLLGITEPNGVAAHIKADSSPVNHHHSEAVEKLLTETIKDDLR